MSVLRLFHLVVSAATLVLLAPCARAGEPAAKPALGEGATFPTLTLGKVTYQDVRVRSVTVRSLVITHRGGMASLHLRDLSPELQQAFGYSPSAEESADAAAAAARAAKPAAKREPQSVRSSDRFVSVLRQFGQPPDLHPVVDLRQRYNELGLFAKNQGRRPSCAIFAVVSALEFQYADLLGHAEKLSEEYIIWATRKALGRTAPKPDAAGGTELTGDEDLGFSVIDVVMALRAYGIPTQERMPNTLNRKMGEIAEPDAALIDDARRHVRASIYPVPVDRRLEKVGNLVHALNAGIPVVVSMAWPYEASIRAGYLDQQAVIPAGGHAVTLVGYTCDGGTMDNLVFIFRNSWGVQWGQSGYGLVTSRFLQAHMNGAFLLEVQPP
jgi:hypothetical protein